MRIFSSETFMCILFIANKMRRDFPLIIAANRDEFYARPTAPSEFWNSHPTVLAGRDLEAGGTWMGVTRNGMISALTNVREPHNLKQNAISRGELVANWLSLNASTSKNKVENDSDHYLSRIRENRHHYNGYNLLFGNINKLRVYNNVNDTTHTIEKGVYGLSNADIATPWPKVTQGVTALNHYVNNARLIDHESLFELLAQDNKAEDDALPDTGIGYEWEKALSSIFIHTPNYGTRTSTLLLVDLNNQITWLERRFDEHGKAQETRAFTL